MSRRVFRTAGTEASNHRADGAPKEQEMSKQETRLDDADARARLDSAAEFFNVKRTDDDRADALAVVAASGDFDVNKPGAPNLNPTPIKDRGVFYLAGIAVGCHERATKYGRSTRTDSTERTDAVRSDADLAREKMKRDANNRKRLPLDLALNGSQTEIQEALDQLELRDRTLAELRAKQGA